MDKMIAAYGQGIAVTRLQMLMAMSAIANRGRQGRGWDPHRLAWIGESREARD
jgi:hypothetical protein